MNNILSLDEKQIEILKSYMEEAFRELSSITMAKEAFKDIVDAAADGSGVEKKTVRTFYNLMFNEKMYDYMNQAAVIEMITEKICE